jgi:WD40 repeat protein
MHVNMKRTARNRITVLLAALAAVAALSFSPAYSQGGEPSRKFTYVAWSPDGTRIATGDLRGVVRIWDAAASTLEKSIQAGPWPWSTAEPFHVDALDWNPDGTSLVVSVQYIEGSTVQVIDLSTEQIVFSEAGGYLTPAVAWSPDSSMFAAGSTEDPYPMRGARVRVWDATTYELIVELQHSRAAMTTIAWSPDGTRLASASYDDYDLDNFVKVWNTTTWEPEVTLDPAVWAEWSPDGTKIASTNRIWDVETGQPLVELEPPSSGILDMAWRPNSSQIAALTVGAIVFWDSDSGRIIAEEPAGSDSLNISWKPDGSVLTYGLRDQIKSIAPPD